MQVRRWVAIIVLAGVSALAHADIHRWKDANGQWQFSDAPPRQGKSEIIRKDEPPVVTPPSDTASDATDDNDLAAQLQALVKPDDVISQFSVSVVAVQTPMGSGSGFFVSDKGYIVTNRHVIRYEDSRDEKNTEAALEEAQKKLELRRHALEREADSIAQQKAALAGLKRYIQNEPEGSPTRAHWQAQYDDGLMGLKEREKDYANYNNEFRKLNDEVGHELDNRRWKGALAGVARSFTVITKDEKKYQARLVSVSKLHDLALLQVEGKHTPFLRPSLDEVSQGMRVYVAGSPLGVRHAVSKGTLVRQTNELLFTDAKVLPGNSGGPMLDKQGRVLGVTTLRFLAGAGIDDGLGGALPYALVRQEFGSWVK